MWKLRQTHPKSSDVISFLRPIYRTLGTGLFDRVERCLVLAGSSYRIAHFWSASAFAAASVAKRCFSSAFF